MLWMYGVAALCLLVCLPLHLHYKAALRFRLSAAFKSLGTLCSASMALTAAVRLDPVCWICFAALLIYSAADWTLEFRLDLGVGLFLVGHVCSIAFFTKRYPVSAVHLICAVFLLAVIAFILYRWRNQIGKRMPLFAVYGVALSAMSACAVGGLTAHNTAGLLTAAAGMLFYISDVILCAGLLFSADRSVDWAVMITYYVSCLLIGFSCLTG